MKKVLNIVLIVLAGLIATEALAGKAPTRPAQEYVVEAAINLFEAVESGDAADAARWASAVETLRRNSEMQGYIDIRAEEIRIELAKKEAKKQANIDAKEVRRQARADAKQGLKDYLTEVKTGGVAASSAAIDKLRASLETAGVFKVTWYNTVRILTRVADGKANWADKKWLGL